MRQPADVVVSEVAQHYRTPAGVVRAVREVSVTVPAGGSVAIMGPSGCGKSTLLGLIGGLETPSAGSVVLGGLEVSRLSAGERDRLRRRHLGMVFQADNLLPYLTAAENVALQLALHGGGQEDRARELLAELGLAQDRDKLPDQLSGGQRLRVAVARALVHRPAVLLADEPTGSVDPGNAQVVLDLLLAAQRTTGATLVVVTHDPGVAGRLQRTLRMRSGSVVDSAGAAE